MTNMNNFRFSVWTPTYNRSSFLGRVYKCLVDQTFKNFEWIIIDDGSTDNTKEIVDKFISDNNLKSIRYIKKENGGKHTAWRVATNEFKADYVITNDSDDTLTPHALEIFNRYWEELENSDEYDNFWEVKGRDQYKGRVIGPPLPTKVFDSNYDELVYKYKMKVDMLACRKASVLRKEAKVPDYFEFDNLCSNFSESIRWARAGKVYKSRFIEEVILTCYFDTNDNLSKSNKKQRSIKSTYNNLISAKYTLEECRKSMLKWDKVAYLETIAGLLYTSFCLSKNPFKILSSSYPLDILLMILGYVPIWILQKVRR